MFEAMSAQYSSKVDMDAKDDLKYPQQIQYPSSHQHLSDVYKRVQVKYTGSVDRLWRNITDAGADPSCSKIYWVS